MSKSDDQLRHLHGQGLNDGDIAAALGCHRMTVRRRRINMGLPPRPVHTSPTKQRQAKSMRAAHRRDLRGAFSNYAEAANRFRAAALGWPDLPLMEACFLRTLREGPRSTPELVERVTALRTERVWRPMVVTLARARKVLSALRRAGLIQRVGVVDRTTPGRGGKYRVYERIVDEGEAGCPTAA